MSTTIKLAVGLCVIMALTLGLVGSVTASPAADSGPPVLNKITFVHGADEAAAKHSPPAKPAKSTKEWYKYGGIHWADSDIPVHYRVNGGNNDWLVGLQASFDTWQADDASYIEFECTDNTWTGTPSSFVAEGTSNGFNEVGWASLSNSYPGAIAVTMIWYGSDKHIVEVDTAMNADLPWTQNSVTGDPNTLTGDSDYFDVQDIMTHEAGHWLMLLDLYVKAASEQTMYGYGSKGELKARTLESGDLAGLRYVYPGATMP
jgi:hypothetical protein